MPARSSRVRLTLLCGLLLAVRPAVAEDLSFDSGGVRIHYRVDGTGEPVLLIHGFTASGVLNWGIPGIIKDLASDHRVITLDNRGHGKSDKPEEVEAYGAEMVEDAVRLMDHLGVESAHVIGYSMGGMIALKMVVEHPSRVRSALLGGMGWTRSDEATRQRYEGSSSSQSSAALTACYRRFWELGITREELEAIQTPIGIVVGAKDNLLERSVRPLQDVRPDIPVTVIPDATHASTVFKPAFRQALRRFLEAGPRNAE